MAIKHHLVAFTLLAPWPALCAGDSRDVDLFALDLAQLRQIVVTPARQPQAVAKAPAIVTVYQRQDIQRLGVTSLIDVLKHTPGLEASMDPDGHWRLAVRGLRQHGVVLLLLDGLPFNDFYDGSAIFELPTAFIDRLEVIRGPGSALYGNNAVVGVVNVITTRSGTMAQLAGGDHGFAEAAVSDSNESGTWSFTGAYHRSDGSNQTVTLHNPLPAQTAETNRWHEDALLTLAWHADDWRWQLFALDRSRGTWAGPSFQAITEDSDLSESQLRSVLETTFDITPDWQFMPKIYAGYIDHDYLLNDWPAGIQIGATLFDNGAYTREQYRGRLLGIDGQLRSVSKDNWQWLIGVVHETQQLDDYRLLRNYRSIGLLPEPNFANHDNVTFQQNGVRREISAGYGQVQHHWSTVELTLGVRLDHYNDYGSSTSPRLGIVYSSSPDLDWKLLYAEAFRAPTLRELYDQTQVGVDGTAGNPDLKPETVATLEVGLEHRFPSLLLRGNIFYHKVDELIAAYDPEGGGSRGFYDNIGEIRGAGAEAELIWKPMPNVQFLINVSRFENEFEWSRSAYDNAALIRLRNEEIAYLNEQGDKRLYHSPRIRLNAALYWSWRDWSMTLAMNHGGRTGANNRSVLEGFRAFRERSTIIPAYRQYDMTLGWAISKQLQLELAGNNLGESKYSDPQEGVQIGRFGSQGLKQPGANYVLRARYTW